MCGRLHPPRILSKLSCGPPQVVAISRPTGTPPEQLSYKGSIMGRATIGIILACVLLVAGGVMVKVSLGAVQPEALRTEVPPTVSVSRAKVGEIHDDVTF